MKGGSLIVSGKVAQVLELIGGIVNCAVMLVFIWLVRDAGGVKVAGVVVADWLLFKIVIQVLLSKVTLLVR